MVFGTKKTMTARDVTGFCPFSPPGNRATFSTFGAISLLNYTENLEKRKKSTGDNSKNPVEKLPRNYRFLSLVVVEDVLTYIHHSFFTLWPRGRARDREKGLPQCWCISILSWLRQKNRTCENRTCENWPSHRTVSEYCSVRVSHVGLSTKQATEPYSDNLLNRTRNPCELYLDKEVPLRRALGRLLY